MAATEMTTDTARDALTTLRDAYGPEAAFRDGQEEAIRLLVDGRARVLLVQRTGWGKSVVYFVASSLLRRRRAGPTLLVSPLLSLMRDQERAAARFGLRVARLDHTADRHAMRDALQAAAVDVLFTTPEQLASDRFRDELLPVLGRPRARGRRRGALRVRLGPRLPAGVPADRPHPRRARRRRARAGDHRDGQPPRHGRRRGAARRGRARAAAGRWRARACGCRPCGWSGRPSASPGSPTPCPGWPGSGIVYTLTIADAERVAGWLRSRGVDAAAYHSRLDDEERTVARGPAARATRSRRWSRRSRSAWASTSPTWASSCTTRSRPRSSPTTSRSAAPAARCPRPTRSCSAATRTRASTSTSSRRRCRRRSRCARCSMPWPRRTSRRRRRGSPGPPT